MDKSSRSSPLHTLSLDDDWSSNPAIEWIVAHKHFFIWGFVALLIALLASSRLITWQTLDAEKDFFQAQTLFTQFEKDANNTENNFTATDLSQLESIMNRYPELKPKYQGALAQTLLVTGQVPQAQEMISDIFKRTAPDHLQLFQSYTNGSVLIQQKQYANALQHAKELKSTLEQSGLETHTALYIYNLVRMATLYQEMGQPNEELKTWEELESQTLNLDTLLAVTQAFQIGNISLDQYIEERKQELKH